ncbi:MAG: PDZ domain-containing protein [Oscillochloris sp.]|nr:PDZ domain-containing protein [Oscillochloris sp.]
MTVIPTAPTTPTISSGMIGAAAGALAFAARSIVVQVRGRGRGHGSGIIWRRDAVLTNYHVVAGAGSDLHVSTLDGARYPARVLAGSPRLDLALLALDNADLTPAVIGDSAGLRVGELVFAIGDPWGQRGVMTAGIVSALGEIPAGRDEQPASYIRSDVRLAPGNSGGPLLNARGDVIGINAMIFGGDLAVAIPAHVARRWAERLPARPVVLGLGVQPVELAPADNGTSRRGLLVAALAPAAPAAKAGLLVGDILLQIDHMPLPHSEALIELLAQRNPGDQVTIDLSRGGQGLSLQVTLAEKQG